MLNTIRGIPLSKLKRSQLCPAINILDESWKSRHGHSPANANSFIRAFSLTWAVLASLHLFLMYSWKDYPARGGDIFNTTVVIGCGFLFTVLVNLYYVGPFVLAIRKLDSLLINNPWLYSEKTPGIESLTSSWSGINEFLVETVGFQMVLQLRRNERRLGTMHPDVVRERESLKQFKDVCFRLGFSLKPYEYYFEKADKQLDLRASAPDESFDHLHGVKA